MMMIVAPVVDGRRVRKTRRTTAAASCFMVSLHANAPGIHRTSIDVTARGCEKESGI